MKYETLIKNLQIIEKHLDRNEKWFQYPEKKMVAFEKDMDEWNTRFLKSIQEIESWVKELEKKLEA
jgi:thiamine kinase-like enzyme